MPAYTLYLLRHGKAVSRGTPGLPDADRALTPDGMRKMRRAADGIARLVEPLDRILTSPLPRARQTADIVQQGMCGKVPLEECPALSPGQAPKDVSKALTNSVSGKENRFLLVGHEPGLSELAAWCTGTHRAGFALGKGGLARIDLADFPPRRPGTLQWLLTPRILRRLSKRKSA